MFLRRFSFIKTILPVAFIVTATVAIVLFGRGYRPNLTNGDINPTGLLVARSDPDGAAVFVDGQLKTATNNTINIKPNWYTVKITKEGFLPWEKRLRVQGEVVSNTDAFLFPVNPSLSPLTATGVVNPVLSPDGTKLAYVVPPQTDESNNTLANDTSGLWVLTMADRPLAFNRDPRQIAPSALLPDPANAQLLWSPDSNQIVVLGSNRAFLFDSDGQDTFQNVTATLAELADDWRTQELVKVRNQMAQLPTRFVNIATDSARIIEFAPDEDKVLYQATASATIPQIINQPLIGSNPTEETRTITKDNYYVYDLREDKNYFILGPDDVTDAAGEEALVEPARLAEDPAKPVNTNEAIQAFYNMFSPAADSVPLSWFPTSRHLILQLPGKIDIMEYDRINWITVYSGPHEPGFVAAWPGSSRLLILTNLNPRGSLLPNLYSVNLR